MGNIWKVIRIEENDYGCEELPEGEEVKVRVTLDDGKGQQRMLLVSDNYLYRQKIDVGSAVQLSSDGNRDIIVLRPEN